MQYSQYKRTFNKFSVIDAHCFLSLNPQSLKQKGDKPSYPSHTFKRRFRHGSHIHKVENPFKGKPRIQASSEPVKSSLGP